MNLLLTDACGQGCPFCFSPTAKGTGRHVTLAGVRRVVRFLRDSGERSLGVLGGEPTLHPRFEACMDIILSAGLEVKLFTHGLFTARHRQYLRRAPAAQLRILVNLRPPSAYPGPARRSLAETCRALADRTIVGATVHAVPFDGDYLIDAVEDFGLPRMVRIGLAMPVYGADNAHITPRQRPRAIADILRFSRRCARAAVRVTFDCGFVWCDFTPAQLGELQWAGSPLAVTCSSVIDVGPDLQAWRCFGASRAFRAPLGRFRSLDAARAYFDGRFALVRDRGRADRCRTCHLFTAGLCGGGCLVRALGNFSRSVPGRV